MNALKKFISPRVLRWLAVSVFFAALGVGLLKLLVGVLVWPYTFATFFSGEIIILLRFLMVDRWVFNHRRPTWKRLGQYHIANALGFSIWWSAANLLKSSGVHYLLASVLAMFVSVGFSMLTNFLWIWRKPAVDGE